jgi:hypothetical protein
VQNAGRGSGLGHGRTELKNVHDQEPGNASLIMKVESAKLLGNYDTMGSPDSMRERHLDGFLGGPYKVDHFRVATALFLQPKNSGAG